MCYIGIDPGLKGGLCVLSDCGTDFQVSRMPVAGETVELATLFNFLRADTVCSTWLEHVNAFPTGSRSSAFTFGGTFHVVLAALQYRGINPHLVRPTVWKKYFGLTSDKKDSFEWLKTNRPKAFAAVKGHDGMAEAYLIAEYGRQQRGE